MQGRKHLRDFEKRMILEDALSNKYSYRDIGEKYGISISTVSRIVKRREEIMDYRNAEGYADPTAYKAINTTVTPGEIWTASTHDPEKMKTLLVIQTFETHAVCLWMTDDLSSIPEGCEEKVMFREQSFCDCSKPQYAFYSRLVKRAGGITFNRLIDIRKKVADIILRGYAEQTAEDAIPSRLEATGSDFSAELDKIPTEEEKPQEMAGNTLEQEDAIRAVLQYKAASLEALTNRLLDIVERAVQKGA